MFGAAKKRDSSLLCVLFFSDIRTLLHPYAYVTPIIMAILIISMARFASLNAMVFFLSARCSTSSGNRMLESRARAASGGRVRPARPRHPQFCSRLSRPGRRCGRIGINSLSFLEDRCRREGRLPREEGPGSAARRRARASRRWALSQRQSAVPRPGRGGGWERRRQRQL